MWRKRLVEGWGVGYSSSVLLVWLEDGPWGGTFRDVQSGGDVVVI